MSISSRPSTNNSRPTTNYSRPYTGRTKTTTRPPTARPQTGVSTTTTAKYSASYVIALIEGRGIARDVGIAALDRETGKVMLVQLEDCQTYVKTLHQMHLHTPATILVPDTFLSASDALVASSERRRGKTSSLLVQYVEEEFPGVPIEPIGRKYWNSEGGLEFVKQLCVEDDERTGTLLTVENKYYALSAACALFKHVESRLNTRFAAGSLRIRYVPVEGTMLVDPETARNLELVGNMLGGKNGKGNKGSLFGAVNYTYTAMAARLLRVNLLSPITAQAAIDARLDVVEEFIQTEDKYTDVKDALKTLNKMDFDKLIAALAASETRPQAATTTAKHASARITQMLNLRALVQNLPLLQKALVGSRSVLLRVVCEMLSDPRLTTISHLVHNSLNEDTSPSKTGIAAINARVYAVKANRNRLLDVARETYKENVGDIYALCRRVGEECGLAVTLSWVGGGEGGGGGFVFCLRKSDLDGELPRGFINAVMQKGKWQFSSMELKKMNARMKDALDESLMLSDQIIKDLVAEILADVGALYKASEAVALVDMLWSFAHVSIMRNYVRPEFTGTLAVKGGRHPILEALSTVSASAGTLVPNDVYCDDSSSFQIVQGPNMSGKSTYLRQIGLLTVLAMAGSFVPAEYASFRIHDALLTRLSNDDDIERNLSTFASEMATSAMILGIASPQSLILIDELGRGTSPREGVGISHAIAEDLIELKAFVFFTTHFPELTTTLSRKPSVVNLHLSVQRTRQSVSNFGMTFQYKIIDGAPDYLDHYGLELARLADLPADVLVEAKRVATRLAALHARHEGESTSSRLAIRRKALLRLRTQLTQAYEHSALPDEELLTYIGRFQADIAKAFMDSDA